MQTLSRRSFLGRGAGATVAAGLAVASRHGLAWAAPSSGYGELVEDPNGLLDLPRRFTYRVVSVQGESAVETPSGLAPVPGDFDGMAAFPGAGGSTILVRNHELTGSGSDLSKPPVPQINPYRSQPGGTTAVVVDSDRKRIREYVTSSGTSTNCAGGATPWGTWITCEETRLTDHGFVYEAIPEEPNSDIAKIPLRKMGYFSHEALDVDPQTGIVYLTEDDFRGSIPGDPALENPSTRKSFLFRYVPQDTRPMPFALRSGGGRLEAMKIDVLPGYNADLASAGDRFAVRWVEVDAEEPHDGALAQGAVQFNRLEGCHFVGGALWFDDTAGGEARLGQVFRYTPATGSLELFFEATDANHMDSPDNIVITPWGDLWFAEDGDGEQRVMGITPEGEVYTFARNGLNESEFCGPCFSPDGRTFFVNFQDPGHTFAIWGPFEGRDRTRQRSMAAATPPDGLGPRISGELADAAQRLGLSPLEAAAYDRLGVPLQ